MNKTYTFRVYDATYRGRKTVIVEDAPTQAAAQRVLIAQGYTRITTAR